MKNWTYPCHLTPFQFVSLASLSVPLTKCNAIWHLSSIHCGDLWTIQDLSVGQSLWWWSMIKERLVNLTSSKFPAFHILQPFGTSYTKRRNVFPILWKKWYQLHICLHKILEDDQSLKMHLGVYSCLRVAPPISPIWELVAGVWSDF